MMKEIVGIIWALSFIVWWIVIFGGIVNIKWKHGQGITFTLSLYSPKRAVRGPKANGTTE